MSLPKKIAVLMGGPGSERDVSLATARGVAKALRSLGAEVVEIDVRDEKFQLPQDVDRAFISEMGSERGVSLATARGVAKALRSLGAEVVEIDVRDEKFQLPQDVDLAFIT